VGHAGHFALRGGAAACDPALWAQMPRLLFARDSPPSDSAIELLDTRAMASAIAENTRPCAGRAGHERAGFAAGSGPGGMAAARRGCASDGLDPNETLAPCRREPGALASNARRFEVSRAMAPL